MTRYDKALLAKLLQYPKPVLAARSRLIGPAHVVTNILGQLFYIYKCFPIFWTPFFPNRVVTLGGLPVIVGAGCSIEVIIGAFAAIYATFMPSGSSKCISTVTAQAGNLVGSGQRFPGLRSRCGTPQIKQTPALGGPKRAFRGRHLSATWNPS